MCGTAGQAKAGGRFSIQFEERGSGIRWVKKLDDTSQREDPAFQLCPAGGVALLQNWVERPGVVAAARIPAVWGADVGGSQPAQLGAR